ncbi:MAG: cbs domain containing protein [Cyclobacteriaceae bacterium]
MIAKELINYMIPPLKPSDNVSKAQRWMDEMRLSELPVVKDGEFLGFINEQLLFDDSVPSSEVGDYPLVGKECFAIEANHYFEILKVSNEQGFKMVAILDDVNQYQGVVSTQDIVEAFARNASVAVPGAILGIRLKINDYSLSEISRIVENNNAKILSSYIGPHALDPEDLMLTLKLNQEEVTYIKVSLEQNGFVVESLFSSKESNNLELERIDSLMNYLKI